MTKPRLLVFASGSKDGGGSGFENLVKASNEGALNASIVGVVSNQTQGGVKTRAEKLGIPFIHFSPQKDINSSDGYQEIVKTVKADFVALSGWLKRTEGLDPSKTFNIHPGPLPDFGGKGMYGHHVHEKVIQSFQEGKINHTEICMHFVTDEYDDGPVFFRLHIPIMSNDTSETLGTRVNKLEHEWQPVITNKIIDGEISWSGNRKDPVIYLGNYKPDIFLEASSIA